MALLFRSFDNALPRWRPDIAISDLASTLRAGHHVGSALNRFGLLDKTWAYEDLTIGASIELGRKQVTAAEIVEFAEQFDFQPMHLDEEAGKASILGGLSASGWHTCCMFMRLLCDGFLLDSTSQGSPGIDFARWRKPVLAGDTLTGRSTAVSKRVSKSRPNLGFVTIRSELTNQRGEIVLELQNIGMFLTRTAV